MKNIKLLLIIMTVISAQTRSGYAQVFNIMQPGDQHVYFSLDIDPVISFSAGYARSFYIELIDRGVTFSSDVTLPYYLLDTKHYRVKLSSRVKILNFTKWYFLNRLSILYSGTDNALYNGTNISLDETILFGHFAERWHVGGEIGYTKFLCTYINHSTWYRGIHFGEAKSGWYSNTGGTFSLGIHGGYKFKETIEATLRLLMKRTEKLDAIEGPLFYGNLGINLYF